MLTIMKRNIKLFFRDKTSVFFSLLAVFIIIGLYVLFLGDLSAGSGEIKTFIKNPHFLMDSWIMAGVIAVTSVTTTFGSLGVMIEDRSRKILKDFSAAPIKKYQLAGGYILSSWVIGLIMCLITFVLAEIYIVFKGGSILPFSSLLKILGLIPLSVLSGSAMVYFIVSFFKTTTAFGTASTVIGTLIGFVTGIYIPIGQLPSAIQTVIKVFPVSHAGVLFRQVMTDVPFEGAQPQAAESIKEVLGITFKFGNTAVSPMISILILIGTAVLFYSLAIWNVSRKKD